MDIYVAGAGWVTAAGWGRARDGQKPVLAPGAPHIPAPEAVYATPPVRYRRFDEYCRIGCAAIALALQDAGMASAPGPRPVGVVASSRYGCIETDLEFHASAAEAGGAFASPSLFSYTLPGIALSEAAIHFRLTGPSFVVGEGAGPRGGRALDTAADLILAGACPAVAAGWLDAGHRLLEARAAGDDGVRGAVFVVLAAGAAGDPARRIRRTGSGLETGSGARRATIFDLLG